MVLSDDASAHEHADGENYFVSMTDMMVGMLFIFIILLMSFALLFRHQTDKQESATQAQKGKIEVAEEVGRRLDRLEQEVSHRLSEIREASFLRARLLQELRDQLSREGLTVAVSPSGDVLRLTESEVRFDTNDFVLRDNPARRALSKTNVGKIARVLARVLPGYAACPKASETVNCRRGTSAAVETVFIEGHTDETGLDDQNWVLSAQRAASTYRELTVIAPELRRILNRRDEEILSISGYSSTRRIDITGTSAGWERNRRIDLRFVMDTDTAAGLEEVGGLLRSMRGAIRELKGSP